ncbi:hypothetical protein GWI33_015561 [Rhynchophorus ferrugineus]|uniref:Uncharacterized protein n=1 Tax=Rhynchophorus ferrugineus TaxID=354439 RepID=A0A834M9M2_RHYFE|nr:hypothetical protein GWI33_015561 [Rhynchophorus ferrugineus]
MEFRTICPTDHRAIFSIRRVRPPGQTFYLVSLSRLTTPHVRFLYQTLTRVNGINSSVLKFDIIQLRERYDEHQSWTVFKLIYGQPSPPSMIRKKSSYVYKPLINQMCPPNSVEHQSSKLGG